MPLGLFLHENIVFHLYMYMNEEVQKGQKM